MPNNKSNDKEYKSHKSYILDSTLQPNIIYSKLGIRIKAKETQDTFDNSHIYNFEIRINNIHIKDIESQCNKQITKDSAVFCYVKDSKRNYIAKLCDNNTSIYIQIDNIKSLIKRDTNNNLIPILPQYIYLSFTPFFNNYEANNTNSQKIALLVEDLDKGYKDIDFKIPLIPIQHGRFFKTLENKEEDKENDKNKSPITLLFNGKLLTIIIHTDNKVDRFSFQAVSGKPQKYNGKYYFSYEKEKQMLQDEGPIPEGEYCIDVEKMTEATFYRNISWGGKNIPIEPNNQETYGRYGFFIHGGWSAGSAGCIDLWDRSEIFFEKLIEHSKKLNITKIPLEIKYDDVIMECSNDLFGLIKQCEAK